MLVCVRVSQCSDSHRSVHSLSLTHIHTQYVLQNEHILSYIRFYLTDKLLGALLFLLTQMGEMPAHTPLTVIFLPLLYLFIRKECYKKLWLNITFGRGHYDI